jgi:hypothetical protein
MTAVTARPQDFGGRVDLPLRYRLHGFDHATRTYIDGLYAQFSAVAGVEILGKPVKTPGGKHQGRGLGGMEGRFWHCITSGNGPEATRRLDDGRCGVLPRVRPLLELMAAGDEARVRWWREGRFLFVAPASFAFAVVLTERPGVWRLKSFYPNSPAEVVGMFERAVTAWRSDPRPIAQALVTWVGVTS